MRGHSIEKDISVCTPFGNNDQYQGQGVAAIYHNWTPESHSMNGTWETTDYNLGVGSGEGGGDDGEGGDAESDPEQPLGSPLLLGLDGCDFSLTHFNEGVEFDLDADGIAERVGWTHRGTTCGWLALDRNENGVIDHGGELFGNYTAQPGSTDPNGYRALAVFDAPSAGGNGDGRIDPGDSAYWKLIVWQDANQDGVSDPWEMFGLAEPGIDWIGLDYRWTNKRDRHGNIFRYWSRFGVRGKKGLTTDVFLVMDDP